MILQKAKQCTNKCIHLFSNIIYSQVHIYSRMQSMHFQIFLVLLIFLRFQKFALVFPKVR